MGDYDRRRRDYGPRGGGLAQFAKRLIVCVVVIGAVAAAVLIYLGRSEEGVVEDMASGLDVVAERLEKGDREGAAEKLRELKAKLEEAGPASHEYSAKAKDALERIKDKSGELYEQARELAKGAGDKKDEQDEDEPTEAPQDAAPDAAPASPAGE